MADHGQAGRQGGIRVLFGLGFQGLLCRWAPLGLRESALRPVQSRAGVGSGPVSQTPVLSLGKPLHFGEVLCSYLN